MRIILAWRSGVKELRLSSSWRNMVFRKSPLAICCAAVNSSGVGQNSKDIIMDAGKLATDELVIALVKERIAQKQDCRTACRRFPAHDPAG